MDINCTTIRRKKEQLLKELDKICSLEKKFPKGELRCAKNESRYKWFVKNQEETIYLSKKEKDLAEKLAVKNIIHRKSKNWKPRFPLAVHLNILFQ